MDFNGLNPMNGPNGLSMMNQGMPVVGLLLKAIILGVAGVFISTAILKWLWNITIPGIFGVREITFWEASRLIIIAGILFGKGFGFNMNF
jgi:hypothetical protein